MQIHSWEPCEKLKVLVCIGYVVTCFWMGGILKAEAQENPVRGLHVVINTLDKNELIRLADMVSLAGFNTMLLDLGGKVAFQSYPGVPAKSVWSLKDFLKIVNYIKAKGIDVIPCVQLLTHQDQLFRNKYPNLMYSDFVYNPEKKKVYELIFPYLEEIIKTMRPRGIHIGHDEVGLARNFFEKGMRLTYDNILPASLFVKDTVLLYEFLSKFHIETWMWGDMLVSPKEFPLMLPRHLHGRVKGYGKALRDKLPKDIVICDWHYWDKQKDFPTVKTLKSEGFRVLASTWRDMKTMKNFSHYSSSHGANGIVATTWFDPSRKTNVIVTEWKEVENLINISGQTFLKDFPDAK